MGANVLPLFSRIYPADFSPNLVRSRTKSRPASVGIEIVPLIVAAAAAVARPQGHFKITLQNFRVVAESVNRRMTLCEN